MLSINDISIYLQFKSIAKVK